MERVYIVLCNLSGLFIVKDRWIYFYIMFLIEILLSLAFKNYKLTVQFLFKVIAQRPISHEYSCQCLHEQCWLWCLEFIAFDIYVYKLVATFVIQSVQKLVITDARVNLMHKILDEDFDVTKECPLSCSSTH